MVRGDPAHRASGPSPPVCQSGLFRPESSTVHEQSPARPKRPTHPIAAALLLLVVGATLTTVVRTRPSAERLEPKVTAQVASVEPVVEPTGTALVDAIPWGRVERVEAADGRVLPLGAPRETPLVLELPEGVWTIALSHPESEEERSCELIVLENAQRECLLEFERLSVDQYFREAGWWR